MFDARRGLGVFFASKNISIIHVPTKLLAEWSGPRAAAANLQELYKTIPSCLLIVLHKMVLNLISCIFLYIFWYMLYIPVYISVQCKT